MFIEDGKGSGRLASVGAENRVNVNAVTSTIEHHINHDEGTAYSLTVSQSNTAAGDCILYMLNSEELDMVIEGFTIGVINCTADDSIYFKIGDTGTRNSGVDVTPVNLNGGSGKSVVGTFEQGADLDGGAATLAGGSEFERFVMAGVTDLVSKDFNFPQDLILPKNRSLTAWVDGSGTGTWYLTIHFNIHVHEV